MTIAPAPQVPPFCPNEKCRYHRSGNALWKFTRAGFYVRPSDGRRFQRFRCDTCRRGFSTRTFSVDYWMKRRDLLGPVFHRLQGCSCYRQIAREFGVSPQTILGQAARLGRHCLLWFEAHRPKGPLAEPVALDSFQSFEYCQDHPTLFHFVTGTRSHFTYGFTETELRRSGRMTERQKARRARIEASLGRPDPRGTEKDVAEVLRIVAPRAQAVELHTDEHQSYPRAVRAVPHLAVTHRTISSRAARTSRNPLFPVNLLDLLLRHSGANHKRETIAFSKRRQSACERAWIFLVWRNWMKSFSERKRDGSPAMRAGVATERLTLATLLGMRLFPHRVRLPGRWSLHYRRMVPTRRIPRIATHALKYAF
jgi:hypothetical protein